MVGAPGGLARSGWVLHGPAEDSSLAARVLEGIAADMGASLRPVPADILRLSSETEGQQFLLGQERLTMPGYAVFRSLGSTAVAGIRKALDGLGVPCVNATAAARCLRDKTASVRLAERLGIAVPRTRFLGYDPSECEMSAGLQEMGVPAVLKTNGGSCGTGVFLVSSAGEALRHVTASPGEAWQIQEFVATSRGQDLRVLAVRGECVSAYRRQGGKGEFRSNISTGGTSTPVGVPDVLREPVRRFCEASGAYTAGVDFMEGPEGWLFCEANGVPGWAGEGSNAYPEALVRAILTSGPTWARD